MRVLADDEGAREGEMAKLTSEFEVTCPCCSATLVVDTNLKRIVRHEEPERGDKPELSNAERILAEAAARREAIFSQSFESEKTRGDALAKRFEEALKQAGNEPITKPTRDFDLD
jgi:hypothetical protein